MKLRIISAIMTVAGLTVLVLGIPLAIAVHRSILDSEVVKAQAAAARALPEIDVPLNRQQLTKLYSEPDAPPPFSVYAPDGSRLFGSGPTSADATVRRALAGEQASTTDGEIVVATPIVDINSEQVLGVLRLSRSLALTERRTRQVWSVMALAAATALIGGWLVAARLARRLAGPAIELAKSAVLVGNGGVLDEPDPTGVSEFDDLAHALAASSQRVNDALQRERQFSADVSHQLRTPLTGLRLTLETAAAQPGADGSLTPALAELERVEATITHLLAFARDAIPVAASTEIADAVRHAETHWAARVRATGRRLVSVTVPKGEVKASATSIDQILNILIDNALAHGRGTITVATRQVGGALAIDVADEGTGIDPRQRDRIFARGEGSHHGIGLALARSIAEAEGARLLLSRAEPTTFSLILLTDHGPGDGPGPGTWTGPDNGAGHGPHDRTA